MAPHTSTPWVGLIPWPLKINAGFLTPEATAAFNGGISLIKTRKAVMRSALAKAKDADTLVVHLTGLGEVSDKMADEAAYNTAKGRDYLAIEAEGLGLSSSRMAPGKIAFDGNIENLVEYFISPEFKELAKGKKVVLSGHSTGAHLALRFALEETRLYNSIFSGLRLQSPALDSAAAADPKNAKALTKIDWLGFTGLVAPGSKAKDARDNPLTHDLDRHAAWSEVQKKAFRRIAFSWARSLGTFGFASSLHASGKKIRAMLNTYAGRSADEKIKGPVTIETGRDDNLIDKDFVYYAGNILRAYYTEHDGKHEAHLDSGPILKASRATLDRTVDLAKPLVR